jgi:hypothetical protein
MTSQKIDRLFMFIGREYMARLKTGQLPELAGKPPAPNPGTVSESG